MRKEALRHNSILGMDVQMQASMIKLNEESNNMQAISEEDDKSSDEEEPDVELDEGKKKVTK